MKLLWQRSDFKLYRHQAGLSGYQYLILENTGITLIDTGLPGSHASILQGIKNLGYDHTDLKHILITHADPDHYGAARALRSTCGAQIHASQIEATAINAGSMSR